MFESAIVFAPSEDMIGAAIRSVKGGIVVVGVLGNIPNFVCFEEKVVKG